jgi:hypothetical protein
MPPKCPRGSCNPDLARLTYPPRQATLASSLNVGISCEEDLPMDHRIMGNLLYLNEKANIICWKDYHMERIAAELNEYRPTVLEANPSLLARCCWYWLDHGIQVYSPDGHHIHLRAALRGLALRHASGCFAPRW